MVHSHVSVLGPQLRSPNLAKAVKAAGVRGRVALVTAGWEEREEEDAELVDHLGVDTVNLRLYERAEEVFADDAELFQAMRARHDRLRALQELYRLRLAHSLEAARELLRREGDEELLEPEREEAIQVVRRLDAHHLARIQDIHAAFNEEWAPRERKVVERHRKELGRILGGCEALCVAGGHVAILLNRTRLFGILELLGDKPIFAWSAGAMALSERVVLFHDSPPQGPGDAEVFESGLGAFAGVVPLPHANHRLRLDDPARVALFARRFGPAKPVVLVKGARVEWYGGRWRAEEGTEQLLPSGHTAPVEAA